MRSYAIFWRSCATRSSNLETCCPGRGSWKKPTASPASRSAARLATSSPPGSCEGSAVRAPSSPPTRSSPAYTSHPSRMRWAPRTWRLPRRSCWADVRQRRTRSRSSSELRREPRTRTCGACAWATGSRIPSMTVGTTPRTCPICWRTTFTSPSITFSTRTFRSRLRRRTRSSPPSPRIRRSRNCSTSSPARRCSTSFGTRARAINRSSGAPRSTAQTGITSRPASDVRWKSNRASVNYAGI